MAQRVLQGLPNLLGKYSANIPGPIGAINGFINGMLEQHIGKYPDEEMYNQLTQIIDEVTFWRDGVRDAEKSETQSAV